MVRMSRWWAQSVKPSRRLPAQRGLQLVPLLRDGHVRPVPPCWCWTTPRLAAGQLMLMMLSSAMVSMVAAGAAIDAAFMRRRGAGAAGLLTLVNAPWRCIAATQVAKHPSAGTVVPSYRQPPPWWWWLTLCAMGNGLPCFDTDVAARERCAFFGGVNQHHHAGDAVYADGDAVGRPNWPRWVGAELGVPALFAPPTVAIPAFPAPSHTDIRRWGTPTCPAAVRQRAPWRRV